MRRVPGFFTWPYVQRARPLSEAMFPGSVPKQTAARLKKWDQPISQNRWIQGEETQEGPPPSG